MEAAVKAAAAGTADRPAVRWEALGALAVRVAAAVTAMVVAGTATAATARVAAAATAASTEAALRRPDAEVGGG